MINRQATAESVPPDPAPLGRRCRRPVLGAVALAAACLVTPGCSFLTPLPEETGLDDRLSAIPTAEVPVQAPVTIHWDERQIPFIVAEHDEDAAVALGIVHAHLRLGMMELGRRLAQGRLSEMVGPPGVDVDQAIRILDVDHAVPAILDQMPDETRRWLESFVRGLNHYQAGVAVLPHEHRVVAIEPEPWTVADLLIFGRLASSDANWSIWRTLLPLRQREDWPEIWAQLAETGFGSVVSFEGMELDDVDEVIGGLRLSGSNAIAVGPARSETGSALFSADPHLGYLAPNIWLLAGLKSPSFHVVGLMPTGLPFFALGRNPDIAWGGTNMYAASSSFYDLSGVDPAEIEAKTETIRVRFSGDETVTVRRTRWGPVISDIEGIAALETPDIALRWVGHLPSDEVTAMLGVNRAASFEEFRAALGSFAVSGINMLYADRAGNIGQAQAVRVPRRENTLPPDIIRPPEAVEPAWAAFADATTLPVGFNPAAGYIASANNRPAEGEVPVGLFFSTDDRIDRIRQLMDQRGTVGLEDLRAMQRDVYMQGSVDLRDALIGKIDGYGIDREVSGTERAILERMRAWDGHYRVDSRGAAAFELFLTGFGEALYAAEFDQLDLTSLTDVIGVEFKVLADLEDGDRAVLEPALRQGLRTAGGRLDGVDTWGDLHRLELVHPFAALPFVGGRYRYGDRPIGGSTQTLMKAGHRRSGEEYRALYGAGARFLADLSDPDANYFVLLGGQDGWFNSPSFMDQVDLWFAGEYVRLPLTVEAAQDRAVRSMTLRP